MKIKFSTGKGTALGTVTSKEMEWSDLANKLTKHKVTSKGDAFFVGGYFKGSQRIDTELVSRTLLTIDIDNAGLTLDELEFALSMTFSGSFVVYSTHSHTSTHPRLRVIAPLSRELTADEYRAFSKEFCSSLGFSVDACSFKPNQLMYTPTCDKGADVWTYIQEGEPLPVPDNIEIKVNGHEVDVLDAALAEQPLDLTKDEVSAYLHIYPAQALDYDGWVEVGMALYHQFGGSTEGYDMWVEWSSLSDKHDEHQMKLKYKSFGGKVHPVKFATIIYRIKQLGGTTKSWIEHINACTDKHELEKLIQKKIANDKSLGTVDLADLEATARAKFSLFGVNLRADPLRKLFKPRQVRVLPDLGGNELPLETIDNLKAVCDNNNVTVRYNVIKKDDEILIPDSGWSIDNGKTASITWLRSVCHKVEMKTTNIKNFVTLLADSNQFNPVVEWVTSAEWDGVSRIEDFYATVQEDTGLCSETIKKIIMKRWMISAIAAAFSPNGIMARGVLVFQGQQYAGKTRWIDSLAPKQLELIKTGRALSVHDKDSVKQIVSAWISELGELDATFKKSDIAALKAFITSDMDELRRPYAAAESQYARRTVFAASVNESNFLQDDTGNSRFWVIPIISINHGHKLNMQQVWAEFYSMWKGGEIHYLTAHEMDILNGHNESFTAPDPIFEMISSHLDWENFDLNDCRWLQSSDVLRWIGKDNPSKYESTLAGKAIKILNKGHVRKSNGKRLSAVPLDKISIEIVDFQNYRKSDTESVSFLGSDPFQ